VPPQSPTPSSIELTGEFQEALTLMEEGNEPLFITGRAGTGKSTLLRYFREHTQRRVVVLAPTGLAAVNVAGQTIHSFFNLPPRLIEPADVKPMIWQKKLFEALDTVIIDEISMVRADLMDAIDRSLRLNRNNDHPFGGVKLIAFGDLHQLSPVVHGELLHYFSEVYDTPYFFSANVLKNSDWQVFELTHNHRQSKDPFFFNLLTRLGQNELTEDDMESLNSRVLTPASRVHPETVLLTSTNAAAQQINARHLDALPEEECFYEAEIKGEIDPNMVPTEADLVLKPGAQVMFMRNDPERRWVNGDIGVVEACSKTFVQVRLRDTVYDVKPVKWERIRYTFNAENNRAVPQAAGEFKQYPLRLAWAITIHKSQGQTLKHVLVDLGKTAFAHGQVYVALSRCESLEGLWMRRPIRGSDVLFDERIQNFTRRRINTR